MFTQPVSTPPVGPQSTPPVSPSRPGRLRGLSYLRSYTQNHLLFREHNGSGAGTGSNTSSQPRSPNHLTRSVSCDHPPGGQVRSNNQHRLTLVNSTPDRARPSVHRRRSNTTNSEHPLSASQTGRQSSQRVGDSSSVDAGMAVVTQSQSAEGDRTQSHRTAPDISAAHQGTSVHSESAPSIRFSAYYDPRSTRPSLTFSSTLRTVSNSSDVIRVGRYSERDNQALANQAGIPHSAAPVGFKSKVVSRRHCEFWCEDGKWYIKDVKSSSGTFLNHIRLSPPSQESRAFPVNDGDIVQLGIDFKGGEEMIFRCVKMRVELNRGWQNKLNTFNMAAHKRLRNMAGNSAPGGSSSSQDCSICLNSIAPCQSLFVAPCSHTWHFKCVRSLLMSPQYPVFLCPNCRAGADLEADVDEAIEEWEKLQEENEDDRSANSGPQDSSDAPAGTSSNDRDDDDVRDSDAMDVTVNIMADIPPERSNATSAPMPISPSSSALRRASMSRGKNTPSPSTNVAEGPITPSNDAGPWVFDGSAGRAATAGSGNGMSSLDAAADMDMTGQTTSEDSSH